MQRDIRVRPPTGPQPGELYGDQARPGENRAAFMPLFEFLRFREHHTRLRERVRASFKRWTRERKGKGRGASLKEGTRLLHRQDSR